MIVGYASCATVLHRDQTGQYSALQVQAVRWRRSGGAVAEPWRRRGTCPLHGFRGFAAVVSGKAAHGAAEEWRRPA